MARNYAQIALRIWRDDDVTTRSRDAQWLYMLLLSQPKLNAAGVITLSVRRWSRLAANTSADVVGAALDELARHRFVVVDEDTEEVLIRSFIRNDGGWRNPNHWPAARDEAMKTESPRLRLVLAHELSRLPEDKRPKDTEAVIEALREGIPEAIRDGMSDGIPDGMPDAVLDDPGVGGYVSLQVGAPTPEPQPTPTRGTASVVQPEGNPGAAESILVEWTDRCDRRPPGKVVNGIGVEVARMLHEGVPADHIREGLAAWARKGGTGPGALPSFVNDVMNRPAGQLAVRNGTNGAALSTTDQRVGAGLTLAAKLRAQEDQA